MTKSHTRLYTPSFGAQVICIGFFSVWLCFSPVIGYKYDDYMYKSLVTETVGTVTNSVCKKLEGKPNYVRPFTEEKAIIKELYDCDIAITYPIKLINFRKKNGIITTHVNRLVKVGDEGTIYYMNDTPHIGYISAHQLPIKTNNPYVHQIKLILLPPLFVLLLALIVDYLVFSWKARDSKTECNILYAKVSCYDETGNETYSKVIVNE